jgi:hypothetical protein
MPAGISENDKLHTPMTDPLGEIIMKLNKIDTPWRMLTTPPKVGELTGELR